MDRPTGFMLTKCGQGQHNLWMTILQHSQSLSTCPFDSRKLPTMKPDTWTSTQGNTINSPATRGLQRWTTSTHSSQAAHCRHPDFLNEGTFPRNNLSWTLVENHTSTHKSGPIGTSSFFSLGVFLLKRGGVGNPG